MGMIASFHCIRYRRAVARPPRRISRDTAGARFWRPLDIGGDFAYFRAHPTRRALYPRLRPDFHHWAFFAVWEDDAALDAFLERSPVGDAWRHDAVEAWHLWMHPRQVRGPWRGMRALADSSPPAADDGPVAEIVYLDLTLCGTLAMWGWAAPHVLAHLPDDDELLLGLPLVDRPYTQPVSFSLWRSAAGARAFAHRNRGHREAIERVRNAQPDLIRSHSAGRFRPYRSRGTWGGRDPLSGVQLSAMSPAAALEPSALPSPH
jgi:hypothetical protein